MRNGQRTFSSSVSKTALLLTAGIFITGAAPAPQTSPGATVTVTITNLRSDKGQILACLTAREDAFPDCAKDPNARKLIIPTTANAQLNFGAVPAGSYAVSVIHDENSNGKLDTRLIIPREGYGFSLDAPVRMGPPKFKSAVFSVGTTPVHINIRMRYLL